MRGIWRLGCWSAFVVLLALGLNIYAGFRLGTYFGGDRATATLARCHISKGTQMCRANWVLADGRRGSGGIEVGRTDTEGERIPVRAGAGGVIDDRPGNPPAIAFLPGVLTLPAMVVPGARMLLGRLWRRQVRLRLLRTAAPGTQLVSDTALTDGDGATRAVLRSGHPGPGFHPSALVTDVVEPNGLRYRLQRGLTLRVPVDTVVFAPGAMPTVPLAVLSKTDGRATHVDIFDGQGIQLGVLRPAKGSWAGAHEAVGPLGETVGLVVLEPSRRSAVCARRPRAPEGGHARLRGHGQQARAPEGGAGRR
ncbi:hypothetical protein [Streptomyces sp. S186]|uniref:hypothetical protein n=1 Tax=Streptomyces sp. S186 TaxID=3434395 RepID=UPI003F66BAD3